MILGRFCFLGGDFCRSFFGLDVSVALGYFDRQSIPQNNALENTKVVLQRKGVSI